MPQKRILLLRYAFCLKASCLSAEYIFCFAIHCCCVVVYGSCVHDLNPVILNNPFGTWLAAAVFKQPAGDLRRGKRWCSQLHDCCGRGKRWCPQLHDCCGWGKRWGGGDELKREKGETWEIESDRQRGIKGAGELFLWLPTALIQSWLPMTKKAFWHMHSAMGEDAVFLSSLIAYLQEVVAQKVHIQEPELKNRLFSFTAHLRSVSRHLLSQACLEWDGGREWPVSEKQLKQKMTKVQ